MNWWIFEDCLRDNKGHWLEYLLTFRRGLEEVGDQATIFVSRECTREIAKALNAEPLMPRSIWWRMRQPAPRIRRICRLPWHALATLIIIRRLFRLTKHDGPKSKAPAAGLQGLSKDKFSKVPDVVFVPTMLSPHLLGWWLLLKTGSIPASAKVLLFFPGAPVHLTNQGYGEIDTNPHGKLFRWIVRQLLAEVLNGLVVLGAETTAMSKALTQATGVPFTYLPQPVRDESFPNNHLKAGDPANPGKPLVFGCYGAARCEKGSDVLQAAIRKVLEKEPLLPAKFIFQWVEDFNDDQGRRVTKDPWLLNQPKVEIINHYFGEGEYCQRLAETDVMMLPYRGRYKLGVSRVLIEAMTAGIPVIVTRETTLWDQAREFGAAIGCVDGSVEDLARCLRTACHHSSDLRLKAKGKARLAQVHFSIINFRKLLLAKIAQERTVGGGS